MQEVWKDVIGFEQYFKVSNLGRVLGKRSGKILAQQRLPTGYLAVATRIGGRQGKAYCFRVHRLVAEAFLEIPPNDLVQRCKDEAYGVVLVRHLDGDKHNNIFSNLAWGCYEDNLEDFNKSADKVKWSAKIAVSNRAKAKLTDQMIAEIRLMYKPRCKFHGCRALAEKFGVHHSQISRAVNMDRTPIRQGTRL